ncbi:hypothetical protein ABMA27_005076 [Loxostege sticticalis]|uniref:BEN domain-containing protein n=1 Tax=Loxostege sticticalis TaxID=481309 RepID=A0ABR3HLR1_LOXSC
MLEWSSFQRVYSVLELSAAEGLMMLWRNCETTMSPTATEVSSAHTPPVTRKSSPTEAHSVPVPEVCPQTSEASRSYLSYVREKERSGSYSDVTESLKDVVTQVIHKWWAANAGAKDIAPATVAKITQEAALKSTQRVESPRAARRLPTTASRLSASRKHKVPIGDGFARVPAYILKTIDWSRYKVATRLLLEHVFGKRVLATHNLTGRPSPAFPNRVPKGQLDPDKVRDIIQTVIEHTGVSESLVRTCITIKCADEGKWLRKQLTKLKAKKKEDLEKKRTAEKKNFNLTAST